MDGRTVTLRLPAPLTRLDVARAARRLTAGEARLVVCDVRALPADAATLDGLARLQLAAGRGGAELVLEGASDELLDLIEFAGLADVLVAR